MASDYERVGELIHRLQLLDESSGLVLHIYSPSPKNPRYGDWRAYRQTIQGDLHEGHGATLAKR